MGKRRKTYENINILAKWPVRMRFYYLLDCAAGVEGRCHGCSEYVISTFFSLSLRVFDFS